MRRRQYLLSPNFSAASTQRTNIQSCQNTGSANGAEERVLMHVGEQQRRMDNAGDLWHRRWTCSTLKPQEPPSKGRQQDNSSDNSDNSKGGKAQAPVTTFHVASKTTAATTATTAKEARRKHRSPPSTLRLAFDRPFRATANRTAKAKHTTSGTGIAAKASTMSNNQANTNVLPNLGLAHTHGNNAPGAVMHQGGQATTAANTVAVQAAAAQGTAPLTVANLQVHNAAFGNGMQVNNINDDLFCFSDAEPESDSESD
ncbi:hypothetical protein PTSG_04514 [Salpingoeca rosetta]|uniref:Uncharacterized protein n=1 Tax=Salpingoeca rosetta (strain ATCC 50818 / BSB-021) TaxID=946362 RepID=F2U8S9_SALR5|nr:uncharacterized protein PTSG_04514 [Salpingoeca rosetta]EGD72787.1 hypothetical protein PTSG_04514 [Salpingoeca rosetta]|eukprot:XP_004994610.1 hypothetical protein PTSG_04514 [Salpingoeca rosetta]